jgi:hypothetical protein
LNFADRLPLAALAQLVTGGLMETLADFSDELDNEQSKKTIDLLSYLLESGMEPEFIKETHDTLLESSLHQAIDLMQRSSMKSFWTPSDVLRNSVRSVPDPGPFNGLSFKEGKYV